MSEYFNGKTEIIIIIILSLLVAFIIGFNILQIIDNKLNSVTINVPQSNCNLPPIYLNLDKDNNIKQIKLNDIISTSSNESIYNSSLSQDESQNDKDSQKDINEGFGNLEDYPNAQDNQNIIAGLVNSNLGNIITDKPNYYDIAKDPDYNTVNNLPLLFSPDPPTPNQASPTAHGYYQDRLKLVENNNSPLMKLENLNLKKLNDTVQTCDNIKNNTIPDINGPYDGYNSFVNLQVDSYANVTGIGKSMLTPYVSFPIPS